MNDIKIRTHKRQSGFTLIEVLVALAIMSVIVSGLSAITFQIFQISAQSSSISVATRQVQNAGQWISRDILQSTSPVAVTNSNEFPITINQDLSAYSGGSTTVVYSISLDNVKNTWQILRAENGGTPIVIADYIDPNVTVLDSLGSQYILTVSAIVDDVTETRQYRIDRRPGS